MSRQRWLEPPVRQRCSLLRGALPSTRRRDSGQIYAWDVGSGKLLFKSKAVPNVTLGLALSPDASTLVSCGRRLDVGLGAWFAGNRRQEENTVQLWDFRSGKELRRLELKRTNGVSGVSFLPEGKSIAVVGKTAVLSTDRKLRPTAFAFSPDGRLLAVGYGANSGDNPIHVWEIASKSIRKTFRGHTAYVTSLAFTDDGKRLASGSWDTTVLLWDVNGHD